MNSNSGRQLRLAVIGAGIAGLACAREVQQAGGSVVVFEKSRGSGGRLATRYRGDLRFDHGAQYVTARSPGFREVIETAQAAQAAAVWQPRGIELTETWYVGRPGMTDLVTPLAEGVSLHLESQVQSIRTRDGLWCLQDTENRELGRFHQVVAAMPARQARELLLPHSRLFDAAADCTLAPCMTAMVAFDQAILPGQDLLREREAPVSWAARNSSKPDRPEAPDSWVLQAHPQWSAGFLEASPEARGEALLTEWQNQLGRSSLPRPCHLESHSWLYARVDTPLAAPFLLDADKGLAACGDWCLGARVEAAWDSGRQLGHMLAAFA
ncbi:NAD(P)/FAD-dependent oxidoreductase [Fodinicurvata halophila]|uniref:NAD(P)/FAD-dependent oxidoreductase n=1 Tax=Fodinicurvata halophila TaxID=1419723 RepID=A0ABV8UN07_9PROT